jgi:hypothetical protein
VDEDVATNGEEWTSGANHVSGYAFADYLGDVAVAAQGYDCGRSRFTGIFSHNHPAFNAAQFSVYRLWNAYDYDYCYEEL